MVTIGSLCSVYTKMCCKIKMYVFHRQIESRTALSYCCEVVNRLRHTSFQPDRSRDMSTGQPIREPLLAAAPHHAVGKTGREHRAGPSLPPSPSPQSCIVPNTRDTQLIRYLWCADSRPFHVTFVLYSSQSDSLADPGGDPAIPPKPRKGDIMSFGPLKALKSYYFFRK